MPKEQAAGRNYECSSIHLNGIDLELIKGGAGQPILFLHPEIGLRQGLPVLDLLARRGALLAPSHPGFIGSSLPRRFDHIDDLAYFYLDLLEELDLRDVLVVGISFGAWIAAEIAIKSCERISHMVLGGPVGIKIGGPDQHDIVDMFAIPEEKFFELAYADPAMADRDICEVSADQAEIVARNRDAAALFGWLPYMYDPKLRDRLHRIAVPTLILKGDKDQIITDHYARTFAELIAGSSFDEIGQAGHFPHVENPREFVDKIFQFVTR